MGTASISRESHLSHLLDGFGEALPYGKFLQTGSDAQRKRWTQVYDAARLTAAQRELIASFVREMKVLVYAGLWCGDCVQQCPLLERIAEASSGKIDLRFLPRQQTGELDPEIRIDGGSRVPVVLFFSEDGEWCGTAGDRTVRRYRALARERLGAMCRTGIVPPEQEELNATLEDWLNEVERIQLMLRLTPRLREKHRD